MNNKIGKTQADYCQRQFLPILVGFLALSISLSACAPKAVWEPYNPNSETIYPGAHWQKANHPEQLGWSSEKLASARNFSKVIGTDAVMIIDDGVVIDAWGDIRMNFQCHSMRKSILSGLIGIHVDEGNIDLDATLGQLGIDDHAPSLSPIEKQATVGDLIKARSGIYHPALGESESMKAMRPKRHSHATGTFWYYNNWDFNALGTIFEQETGTRIFQAFDRRVAVPLQMEDFHVDNCKYATWADYKSAPDSKHRYYLFRMSARDLARFGLLFLRQGRWQNQQVVPSDWVRESTASHSEWGVDGGYGYMWWTGKKNGLVANVTVKEHSYYASGYGGHRLFVLPYRKLVIVHRVNTDSVGRRPMAHQIGRLVWLILAAAGETGIGDDPSISAAKGTRLNKEGLNQLLKNGSRWVGPNNAIFQGGRQLVLSCAKDGTLLFSPSDDKEFSGKWWISGNRFYFKILGLRSYFKLIQEGNVIKLFDRTDTLFGNFHISSV